MSTQPPSPKSDVKAPSLPIVFAVTGASGSVYTVRLLQQLLLRLRKIHFVISPSAETVLYQELGIKAAHGAPLAASLLSYRWPSLEARWGKTPDWSFVEQNQLLVSHHYGDYMSPIASGSHITGGMVVCPCSGATLSGIVRASGDNLIQRAADVHLKEHRKLILVPRETPLSVFQLENMHRAAQAGAIVLPAMPGWYHGVESLIDLVDFVVARILDHLEVDHQLMRRWGETS